MQIRPDKRASGVMSAAVAGGADGPPAVFMFDRSLRLTLAAGTALEQRGWNPEALIGRDIRDLLPPSAVADLLPHYQLALDGVTSSFTIRSPDGERLYSIEAMPVTDRAGEVTGGVALARDITDHLETQRALAESEERYRRAFRDAPVGMVEASLSGELLDVNAAFSRMLGYPPEYLIGTNFADVTHPDDRERDLRAVMELADRPPGAVGEPVIYRAEKRYLAMGGGEVWADVAVRLLRDEQGRPARFVAQVIDISARKRAEMLLRWSETRFRALASFAPVGISIADASGSLTYANPRFCELVGMTAAQAMGDGWKKAIHPDDRKRVFATRDRVVTETGELSMEHRIQTPDGDVRWVHSASVPLRDAHGEPAGRIGTVTDITERVTSARRFEQLLELAPDALIGVDGDGVIVLANRQTGRVFGYQDGELIGQPIERLLPERLRAGHGDHIRAFYEHPSTRPMGGGLTLQALRRDGSELPCEVSLAAIEAPDATIAVAAVRDVTDRVRAERLYRAIAENFPNGVIMLFDLHLRLLLVRGQGLGALGVDPAQVESRNILDGFGPDVASKLEPSFRQAIAGDTVRTSLAIAGRSFAANVVPLRGGSGEVFAGMLVAEDVTERQMMEEALRRSEDRRDHALSKMVRAQEEERARIAADLHDDTVQVMTAALIALDRIARQTDDRAAQQAVEVAREVLSEAIDRTRRMTFDLRPQLLEAEGLAAAVPALAEDVAAEAGFDVSVAAPVGRYSAVTESLVFGLVREALANTRRHAQASHVAVRLREHDGAIRGEISDDGVGFDIEAALDRARLTHHIGLDTTIEKLRLAGGELTIDSSPGKGTRILFTLPAR